LKNVSPPSVLLDFLNDSKGSIARFSPQQWSLLVRQARATNLLSRVASRVCQSDELSHLPGKIMTQLNSANTVGASSARSVKWEVQEVAGVLAELSIPCLLLKGAAYEMANLPPAAGRLFADVDIMVSHCDIQAAERSFIVKGWTATKLNAYDQKYYRKWMHEIPPLLHRDRSTLLDVHHTILPPTAGPKPDVQLLWSSAVELEGFSNVYMLAPEDMVLHSAAHLFHDGDLAGGLRDLVDLDGLLRHFGTDPAFIGNLFRRAQVMGLWRPLYYALRYCGGYLNTPLSPENRVESERCGAPNAAVVAIMDFLVGQAFYPRVESREPRLAGFTNWLLYVRSHYLRMPLYLLLPHLLRKALRSED
jgi:hypothetical protein